MKLTSRARHSVRLALEVARRSDGGRRPVCLSEVARITGISRAFLEQLAIALKSHGLLRGVSGRRGGYLLTRPAGEITIGNILRAVTGPIDLAACTEEPAICMSADFCECRLFWLLLKQRINGVLDEHTLADIDDKSWQERVRETTAATS